jgi:hypothetical protein
MSHSQIATGGPNLISPPHQIVKHSSPNHWVAGIWLNWPGDRKAAPFCGRINLTKNQRLGGGLPIAKLHPAGQIQSVCPFKIFKHTTINHQVAGLWPNRPGDGKGALFCGRDNSTKIRLSFRVGRHSQITSSGPKLVGPPG